YWSKHAEIVSQMFSPVGTALIEDADICPTQSVLDVAGGAGDPSMEIAKAVGAAGLVVTTDAIDRMIATARARSEARGLRNIEFQVCRADFLPYRSNSFDASVCRFGVMLFSDPSAAVAEMLRVVRPAGRIALAVWSRQDANPFFYVVAETVSRYIEAAPEDP